MTQEMVFHDAGKSLLQRKKWLMTTSTDTYNDMFFTKTWQEERLHPSCHAKSEILDELSKLPTKSFHRRYRIHAIIHYEAIDFPPPSSDLTDAARATDR